MTIPKGTRLGPYEIDVQIGAGGMGAVYRGVDSRLERNVAIKILPSLFASDPGFLARFEREANGHHWGHTFDPDISGVTPVCSSEWHQWGHAFILDRHQGIGSHLYVYREVSPRGGLSPRPAALQTKQGSTLRTVPPAVSKCSGADWKF
jgi:serine/threonine protein kinase